MRKPPGIGEQRGRLHHPASALDHPGPVRRVDDHLHPDACGTGRPVGAREEAPAGHHRPPQREVRPERSDSGPVPPVGWGPRNRRPRAVVQVPGPNRERHRGRRHRYHGAAGADGLSALRHRGDPAGGDRGVTPQRLAGLPRHLHQRAGDLHPQLRGRHPAPGRLQRDAQAGSRPSAGATRLTGCCPRSRWRSSRLPRSRATRERACWR